MARNAKLDNHRPVSSSLAKAPSAKMPVIILSISVALALSVISYARPNGKNAANSKAAPIVSDIDNFGQVTDFYFRGEQPKGGDYSHLAAIGVKTIIDLRDDPKDYAKMLTE